MGATYEEEKIDKCSTEQLRKKFSQLLDELRDENGHQEGYSGDFQTNSGLSITFKEFTSRRDASNWLSDNTEKWDNVLAVKVYDVKTSKSFENKINGLKQKRSEVVNELNWEYDKKILARVKAQKVARKTCKKCGSAINKDYLTRIRCPVCGNEHFLYTESDLKKLESLKQKIKEFDAKIDAVKKEGEKSRQERIRNDNSSWYWLLGACCAC